LSTLYLLLIVLALIISGFGWSKKLRKLNIPFSWFFIYAFSLLLGFRSRHSGVDTMSYFNYFNDIASNRSPDYSFELGFTYFTYLIAEIFSVEVYIFLLSFMPLFFLYLSSRLLKIENRLFCIVLFIAFIPGLDMLTNAVRGGLALTIGLALLVATVIRQNKFAVLNFLPMLVHASYGIVAIISLFPKRFSGYKIHLLLFSSSLFFFATWIFINPLSMLSIIEGYSQDVNSLGKLVRYLLLEKELMSLPVKLYFVFISILFSCIYFLTFKMYEEARHDEVLSRMVFIILSTQFVYALFSFSQYSFRFMFLAYPLQIIMTAYVLDKYYSGILRNIIVFLLCSFGLMTTYTTHSFSSFELLSL